MLQIAVTRNRTDSWGLRCRRNKLNPIFVTQATGLKRDFPILHRAFASPSQRAFCGLHRCSSGASDWATCGFSISIARRLIRTEQPPKAFGVNLAAALATLAEGKVFACNPTRGSVNRGVAARLKAAFRCPLRLFWRSRTRNENLVHFLPSRK